MDESEREKPKSIETLLQIKQYDLNVIVAAVIWCVAWKSRNVNGIYEIRGKKRNEKKKTKRERKHWCMFKCIKIKLEFRCFFFHLLCSSNFCFFFLLLTLRWVSFRFVSFSPKFFPSSTSVVVDRQYIQIIWGEAKDSIKMNN